MTGTLRYGERERIQINVARLKKGGEIFEIDIDPDQAVAFKEGKGVDIKDVVKAEKVFTDTKKGLLASEHKMQELFGTADPLSVAKIILEDGEIQLTAEHRAKLREEKRKRIIETIRKNGIDPRTGLPHPLVRIENAFEEGKIRIDEFKPQEKQVQDILKLLQPILPIRFETRAVEVIIESKYAGKIHATIRQFGKITKEEWQGDGSWKGTVEIPAGMQEDFFDRLNSLTHGEVHTKLIGSDRP